MVTDHNQSVISGGGEAFHQPVQLGLSLSVKILRLPERGRNSRNHERLGYDQRGMQLRNASIIRRKEILHAAQSTYAYELSKHAEKDHDHE